MISALVYPNTHIINGSIKNNFWPHYGIDLIIFKISKDKAIYFLSKSYNQYDWGINENFYVATSEALKLKRYNLFKFCNVIKFNNDFEAFTEDRSWQENPGRKSNIFTKFFEKNQLSELYAYGSYYYLLFKIFNFKDLNFNLILSYLIFYPFNLFKN